jgi:hypothetical protein
VNKDYGFYRRFGRRFVAGWLTAEVLDIVAILDSAQRAKNVSGAVAEIGVHHGKLFIGLNLLRQNAERSVAIDLFGQQELNVDNSGKGNLKAFRRNTRRWSSLNSVAIHQGDSSKLQADELRELAHGEIRLFSVDGGHTSSIVLSDMNLAGASIVSGGIVIADDIFNQEWPGVLAGTLRYLSQGGQLVPFAIAFNKVFFSAPEYSDFYRSALRDDFDSRYLLYVRISEFATHEVLIIGRVPRRPRELISRNGTARKFYHRLRDWNDRRNLFSLYL